MAKFLDRYFRFITGVGGAYGTYDQLAVYLELGGELDEICKSAMSTDSFNYAHTTSVRVDSTTLNGAVFLGDGYYLVDVSASTTVTYPGKSDTGEVSNDQSMKIIVKETAGEIRAVSLEKYA